MCVVLSNAVNTSVSSITSVATLVRSRFRRGMSIEDPDTVDGTLAKMAFGMYRFGELLGELQSLLLGRWSCIRTILRGEVSSVGNS